MAVTAWHLINDGRGGKESYQQDGTTVTTRTRCWRVDTDANTDDDYTVMSHASAPKIGASHPNHAACRCIDRSCQPESRGQKKTWIFTAEYSTKWDISENPLNDPAKTRWTAETFQRPVWETVDGKGIVNSAGDPFDPPAEKDDSRWVSVTTKNVPTYVPTWIFSYQDAVNSGAFTIDGVAVPAQCAKISGIDLGEVQERNEIEYRVLTITIHYRGENQGVGSGSGSYGSGSAGDDIAPWDLNLLDQGMRQKPEDDAPGGTAGRVNILNELDGLPVSSPVPLDGEGRPIKEPTLDNAVYLQFQVYFEKAFSALSAYFV